MDLIPNKNEIADMPICSYPNDEMRKLYLPCSVRDT